MALTEVKATKGERTVAVAYDFGENLADAAGKFGDEVVFSGFKRTSVITAQAIIRRGIDAGKTDDQIVSDVTGWKPGVALTRTVDPFGSILRKIDSGEMTEEQLNDLAAKIKAARKR